MAALRALEPDLGVVVAFGQFIPKRVRELPKCGYLINAHASLLPKYRGASPIACAILNGDAETGVSVMRVEREMDAGAVALVRTTPIAARENTAELSVRLGEIAAEAISEAADRIAQDTIEWTEQDAARASLAPKFEKADAILDWREPARALAQRIHALAPKPGAKAAIVEGEREEPIKILQADALSAPRCEEAPGTLVQAGSGEGRPEAVLAVATGDGWLAPLVVQRAGGKAMPIADFLRGFPVGEKARMQRLADEAAS